METNRQIEETTRVVGLRAALLEDHAEVEHSLEQLVQACRADAREDVAAAWTAVDRRLARHLTFEEEVLFPELAKIDPYAVDGLLRDHARIRSSLFELGVEVDLHLVRLSRVQAFVTLLRGHARREDDVLYRWAEEHLPEPARRRATRFLRLLLRHPLKSRLARGDRRRRTPGRGRWHVD
jgi:hypothetical protein